MTDMLKIKIEALAENKYIKSKKDRRDKKKDCTRSNLDYKIVKCKRYDGKNRYGTKDEVRAYGGKAGQLR